MTRKAQRIANELTPAQAWAMVNARDFEGDLVLRIRVNMTVRRNLFEKGLLSRRVLHPLNALGREVRAILLTKAGAPAAADAPTPVAPVPAGAPTTGEGP
jgi:hypothetical protein